MSDENGREVARLRARIVDLEERLSSQGLEQAQTRPKPSGRASLGTVRIVHRWAAVLACGFLLLMGVSGIVLAHADVLGLQPLMVQLHAGLFIGPYAWLYCDVVGVALVVLAISGVIMYLTPRTKVRR